MCASHTPVLLQKRTDPFRSNLPARADLKAKREIFLATGLRNLRKKTNKTHPFLPKHTPFLLHVWGVEGGAAPPPPSQMIPAHTCCSGVFEGRGRCNSSRKQTGGGGGRGEEMVQQKPAETYPRASQVEICRISCPLFSPHP